MPYISQHFLDFKKKMGGGGSRGVAYGSCCHLEVFKGQNPTDLGKPYKIWTCSPQRWRGGGQGPTPDTQTPHGYK